MLNGSICEARFTSSRLTGIREFQEAKRTEALFDKVLCCQATNRDVVNVDTENGRQMFAVYKLAHDTTPEKIRKFIDSLEDAVKSTPGTKEMVVTGLIAVSEIALDVMLLYWVEGDMSKIKTRTEINLKILEAMAGEEIEFSDRTIVTYNKDIQY